MEGFLVRCMFCVAGLPPLGKRGRGEHVVPELLGGSWRIKDVCRDCNSYFGAEVDHLVLEDWRVAAAIRQLDLPDLKAHLLDRAHAVTVDSETGRRLRSKTKHGKVKIIRQEANGVIDHHEAEAFDDAARRLRRQPPPGLSAADAEVELLRVQSLYAQIERGQSVTSEKLGQTFRKRQATTTHEFRLTKGAASRLVAKIAYESAFVFLSVERLQAYWPALRKLLLHARHAQPLEDEEFVITMPPDFRREAFEASKARYGHAVTCTYHETFAVIRVSFFGIVDFNVNLLPAPTGAPLPVQPAPTYEGVDVEHARVVMTFEPGDLKRKLGLLFLKGEDRPRHFELTDKL